MSSISKPLLFLLQRCVAVRQVTLRTGITTGGRSGFIQRRAWTSTTGTACLQRLCQPLSAVKTSQYSFCTKEGNEYPPLPDYQCETVKENTEVHLLQVKGIPWSCTAQNLLHFFSDCKIRDGVKGIHLIMNRLGKPSGRALVEMEDREDVIKALEKHRQYLGPRYVEVYEVTNDDAEVMLKNTAQTLPEEGMVRLRGLPFVCTEADITRFFSGLDIVENGINIMTNNKGRNTGDAFVQFSSQEAADEALKRDREVIGHRYIEVFPHRSDRIIATERINIRSNAFSSQTHPRTGRPQSSAPHTHYVHLRGLPFQVSGEDIIKFFSPLVVSKILLECHPDGRLNGEADVYFSCQQDAMSAMSRDRQHMGERYIELYLNSAESD